eukprot:3072716-Alexandrium_andersonii.AAC.1
MWPRQLERPRARPVSNRRSRPCLKDYLPGSGRNDEAGINALRVKGGSQRPAGARGAAQSALPCAVSARAFGRGAANGSAP